jgi:dCTP deaminase
MDTIPSVPVGPLCDRDIERLAELGYIKPFNHDQIQPASYDVTLHETLLLPPLWVNATDLIDLRRPEKKPVFERHNMSSSGWVLQPKYCVLGALNENITCPANVLARVEGKSTWGRCFLAVHVTAGFVDPGWDGRLTLEIVNHGPWPIQLWPGMKIAQINFTKLATACNHPYGSDGLKSHYQGQDIVTGPSV